MPPKAEYLFSRDFVPSTLTPLSVRVAIREKRLDPQSETAQSIFAHEAAIESITTELTSYTKDDLTIPHPAYQQGMTMKHHHREQRDKLVSDVFETRGSKLRDAFYQGITEVSEFFGEIRFYGPINYIKSFF